MARNALIYLPYPDEYLDRIAKSLECNGLNPIRVCMDDQEKAREMLMSSEIVLLGKELPQDELEASPAKWIHFDWVGIEKNLNEGLFRDRIITNGSGRNSICLAEHALFFMLSLSYGIRDILEEQEARRWMIKDSFSYRTLCGKTALILGIGSIGKEIARLAKALGMKTIGFSRSIKPCIPYIDKQIDRDLDNAIMEADFVIDCLPLNNSTVHFIDIDFFSKMKKTAFFINISRGGTVDESALEWALGNNVIAGAASDVFEKEPLSRESVLWGMPNMIITPHRSPQNPMKFDIGTDTIIENIGLFCKGARLRNQQTLSDIYSLN